MKWGRVIVKFLKGFVLGGLGAIAVNPAIVTPDPSATLNEGGVMALVVGLLNAFLNWYKHRKDN